MEKGKRTLVVSYEIEISESAEKSLEKVPKRDRIKILEKIDALEGDPIPEGSIIVDSNSKETFGRRESPAIQRS